MGTLNVTKLSNKRQKANYFHHLIRDLEALEIMVKEGMFEKSPIRIGAELEFFIVGKDFFPESNSLEILKLINDSHFTTEIGNYNLEINLDPLILEGNCFSSMHEELKSLLEKCKDAAKQKNSKIIITGILPTITHSHITLENMTPVQRYYVLNDAAKKSRGQDFSFHIRGVDELNLLHDSVMLESCNTSWQMHLQIDPDEFMDMFNWAQVIAGPVLAACCNSPILFGKELWSETRIALFTQSVDVRTNSFLLNDSQSRVSFEDHWQIGSISDIFKDNISRFRSLVTEEFERDSIEILKSGEIPKLRAMCLHNGTVYRWNRACYGLGDGKPHLRIENRYIPAGPTMIDQIANMAFWVGLMKGRNEEYMDIHQKLEFKDVKANFFRAARYGMATQFSWNNRLVSSQDLILEELIPMARIGLQRAGISYEDIDKYLSIIINRVKSRNGAEWIVDSYRSLLKSKKKNEANQVLLANIYLNQEKDVPVSEWEVLPSDASTTFNIEKLVMHVMNTSIISVEKNDPVELVVNIMKWKNIHHMPVVKGDKELIGLLTWTDVKKYFDQSDEIRLSVQEIMKTELVTISQDKKVDDARQLMAKYKINCLPVTKGSKLVGIVTSNDI
jgi:CBS domain-containing protein